MTKPVGSGSAGSALYGLVAGAVRRGPRDVSLTAASTLSTLDRSGPRRITDLSVIEGVTQPSMTLLVSRLERSGLVERCKDPSDKRVALVALTDAGRQLIHGRRRAGAEAFDELIAKLPPEEIAALQAAIGALEHLRDLEAEHWEQPGVPPEPRR
jgi:DNA-binding MarR family transcriptional regulator